MPTAWVSRHREQVQKIVIAFVRALDFIRTHSAEEIAAQMPESYYATDRRKYVAALETSKRMFTADGFMPENGPPTVLKVMSGFNQALKGKSINLANTYTNAFVEAARP
jgi:NitT/TauT family transport system substrate-binding protein